MEKKKINIKEKESPVLSFLYKTVPGRAVLKVVSARWVSTAVGKFMDSPLSKPLIKGFVNKNGIDLSEFESDGFNCFNDFDKLAWQAKRVQITERSGVTLVPKTDSRGRLSLQLSV